jgi:hypothetical protein
MLGRKGPNRHTMFVSVASSSLDNSVTKSLLFFTLKPSTSSFFISLQGERCPFLQVAPIFPRQNKLVRRPDSQTEEGITESLSFPSLKSHLTALPYHREETISFSVRRESATSWWCCSSSTSSSWHGFLYRHCGINNSPLQSVSWLARLARHTITRRYVCLVFSAC